MTESSTRSGLTTDAASQVFDQLTPTVRMLLEEINGMNFQKSLAYVEQLSGNIAIARSSGGSTEEAYLNELYVLDRYADFFRAYTVFWKNIYQKQFHPTAWDSLQDALSLLRVIKRFSNIDIACFEYQITEIEKLFPYKIFGSVGFLIERFTCSTCGEDIDSVNCPHRHGHLYHGVMAQAVADGENGRIDHVAIVENPRDKRCVLWLADGDSWEAFHALRFLSEKLVSGEAKPLDISHLVFSKRTRPNPQWKKLGRNDLCFCGSGKKFKKCCQSKRNVETDHVDIVRTIHYIHAPGDVFSTEVTAIISDQDQSTDIGTCGHV